MYPEGPALIAVPEGMSLDLSFPALFPRWSFQARQAVGLVGQVWPKGQTRAATWSTFNLSSNHFSVVRILELSGGL